MTPDTIPDFHRCYEHSQHAECDSVEPHGEWHHDEWYECSVCGNKYTPDELEREQIADENDDAQRGAM